MMLSEHEYSKGDAEVFATTATWLRLAAGCSSLPGGSGEALIRVAGILDPDGDVEEPEPRRVANWGQGDAEVEPEALALYRLLPAGQSLPLARAGLRKLGDICTRTEAQVAAIPGIGPKTLAYLRQALQSHGLAFATAEAMT